jgi:hypothetical protein
MIACTCVAFASIAPNIWLTRKVVKEFGWGIYKKIGASMKLQSKFLLKGSEKTAIFLLTPFLHRNV